MPDPDATATTGDAGDDPGNAVPRSRRTKPTAAHPVRSRTRRVIGRVTVILATLLAVVIVLTVAGVGLIYYQGTKAPAGDSQYVALGSSFGAGPGVGTRAPDSPNLCIRSAQNYAHQLAAARHLNLTDVSCSGATTQNVLHGGQYFQPPQVDALRPDTQLVTVTVGGNDISYLGNLFAWSCQADRHRTPLAWRPAVCTVTSDADVDRELADLPTSMKQIATDVHQRSPHATLVFVDYTTVLPDTGSCQDRLPITDQEVTRSRALAAQLAAITAAVARDSGALLIQASTITHGHDICSADPWVFGYTFARTPFNYGPMAYHPTQQAMTHIADAINHLLPPSPTSVSPRRVSN
ncbi:SGNH/GDSL hydrolase family protein [Pseudonocardia xinjiangensis]|uniref:SGNH/GDSL hydrolase family protein n=1 Tax=Pseudonocardia xinjiangensis TaxID=75289 RepID=UPI003D8FD1B9